MISDSLTKLFLAELQELDGPSDIDTADRIGLDVDTFRRLLDQLRERGLVAHEETHADGSARWGVTPEGQRWLGRRRDGSE